MTNPLAPLVVNGTLPTSFSLFVSGTQKLRPLVPDRHFARSPVAVVVVVVEAGA